MPRVEQFPKNFTVRICLNHIHLHDPPTYLGNCKQVLCDINHTAQILNILHARLDSIGVIFPRRVENVFDLVALALGPCLVSRPCIVVDSPVNGQERQHSDALLVDHVQLIADGGNGQAGTCREDGGLGRQAVARKCIENRVRRALGILLRNFAILQAWSGCCEAGYGRQRRADREGRPDASSACQRSVFCSMSRLVKIPEVRQTQGALSQA